jgi:hypothetical protein
MTLRSCGIFYAAPKTTADKSLAILSEGTPRLLLKTITVTRCEG